MAPAEVASVFQVDPRTIWRWEQAGDLECIRLPSGVRRYFRAHVDALVRGEKLTPEQVRAVRDELTARAKGRPTDGVGKDS
jgi:predicted site-specific integrase-resolvase